MAFRSVSTYSYRNLHDQKVPLDASRIFLVGENGQGKSNFLESIYLLSYGNSFRTRRDGELITFGKRELALHGTYQRPDEDDIPGTVAFKLSGGEKEILLDGKRIQDRKQLISHIPAVVFSHDDISFVSGSPERRRWFFNQIMSLFDPLFIDTLRDYRKILKMRNTALKEQRSQLIPVYDQQLAQAGLEIQHRRRDMVAEFNQVVAPIFDTVSGLHEPFSIEYRPSWKNAAGASDPRAHAGASGPGPSSVPGPDIDAVLAHLAERRQQDLLYGTTTSGPHRDRFIFRLAKTDFARIASTGQLRLMSLILRIGQCRYFSEKTGRRPILLLDDVLLELDGARRKRFLDQLPAYDQVFFTFLPDEKYLELGDADTAIYEVHDGWIQKKTSP